MKKLHATRSQKSSGETCRPSGPILQKRSQSKSAPHSNQNCPHHGRAVCRPWPRRQPSLLPQLVMAPAFDHRPAVHHDARLATRRVLVLAFCQSFGGLSPKLRPCIVGLPTIVSVRSVEVALDVRESGTAAQPVKSETFSDQWHVRVYSHAAGSWSRSHPF